MPNKCMRKLSVLKINKQENKTTYATVKQPDALFLLTKKLKHKICELHKH